MGDVHVEQRGRVLVATLENLPHGLLDATLIDGLERLVGRADGEHGVGAVVLTGAHPHRFVAHYDVGEILAGARQGPTLGRRGASAGMRAVAAAERLPGAAEVLARSPASELASLARFHRLLLDMGNSGAVFVAALNGSALGGGCELALACDVRLMAEREIGIGQPEILLGFPPGGGGTQRLTRLLGTGPALRLILDGRPLAPRPARELGLVDELVEPERITDRALELAARLGGRPKHAVAACKRLVYDAGSRPLADGLRAEQGEFVAAAASPIAVEAMSSYVRSFEQTGELPAYDPAALRRADEAGRFGSG